MDFNHTSVLLRETIEQLKVKPDGIYVDGTLGGGGTRLGSMQIIICHGEINRNRPGRCCNHCCLGTPQGV